MSASAQKLNSQSLLLWLAHGSSGHSFRLGTPPHQFRTRNDRAEKRRTRSTSPGQEAAIKVDAFNFIRYGCATNEDTATTWMRCVAFWKK